MSTQDRLVLARFSATRYARRYLVAGRRREARRRLEAWGRRRGR